MCEKIISEINIIYDIMEKDIKLFGTEFVKNNKNICKMIIDNKEYEIKEKYSTRNYNSDIIKIKPKGINDMNNMSFMFDGCISLLSLSDISKWKTNNNTEMSKIFNGCKKLASLPDISK